MPCSVDADAAAPAAAGVVAGRGRTGAGGHGRPARLQARQRRWRTSTEWDSPTCATTEPPGWQSGKNPQTRCIYNRCRRSSVLLQEREKKFQSRLGRLDEQEARLLHPTNHIEIREDHQGGLSLGRSLGPQRG